jgi:hypothetical protein
MERHIEKMSESLGLHVGAVPYKYRYCPRCRREWPAKLQSCPECVHWLGEQPLERTEWQLIPAKTGVCPAQRYELIGASALILRFVCANSPSGGELVEIMRVIREILEIANDDATCEVGGHGWLVWTAKGLREAFRLGCKIERQLAGSLLRFENILAHTASIRWGIWTDQYLLPFDQEGLPVIGDVTACAIFDFEPDKMFHSSEAIYRVNRRWEHFVCVPRRLLNGQEDYGYCMLDHKRPSARDHAEVKYTSPFVGRDRELSIINNNWSRADRGKKLAIVAPAGSGKTRLIKEWLARHKQAHAIIANFSLFGGDVDSFASQLAELPPDRLDCDALVQAVVGRIHRDKIVSLVLDDIHWAAPEGLAFVHKLLDALSTSTIFVILASRPSGYERLRMLQPTAELKLKPLPPSGTRELAGRLIESNAVATIAAGRSKGNPLFVEQFAAWAAETKFSGGKSGPRNVHQVIAARIKNLSDVRIKDIQQHLRWGQSWVRQGVNEELRRLEVEIGLWLDRLETGDYADRVEAARHLVELERLDYEIFITSMLAGRPRPRSSRLREAIERLLIGSADQILTDLSRRATKASVSKENIAREAKRAGDALSGEFNWSLAQEFYALASSAASSHRENIGGQLDQCRRHCRAIIENDQEIYAEAAKHDIERSPSVDSLDLPYVWAELGRRQASKIYFKRAAEAAKAINDQCLVIWAKRKAAALININTTKSQSTNP